ncbi:glucosaminidase domain-containing protein [Bacteroides caccae]|uniref:glucosaminidase domain-containing protein n=1 Tax=Bacteroides caccae TaxID=47678 RepID=UPI001C2C0B67|nr:glucosaminidase domain-containing protein [Bacteroides caccae]MBU9956391.1 glucosaminidase domain-containing protein [Bacteroides caccae]MBV3650278.1 glucosaminidase domain-containing protein [Bacteroides caccae]MBV3674418.1 glucosaminidase domain-containing protein [Bacteroides caccae]MBV3681668.1 glucosaminidase domain-containing protein [Bacteroides caccae]MBV3699713.1 glucosaminidase domain-containing protein [Bacteroides caccae]
MRKKFIKSSRPTYKKRIKKAQQGMKFVSYNPVSNPTIDYTDITNPINPFSEYNYNTTYDKPEALVVPVRDTEETDVVANNPTVEPVINKPVASKPVTNKPVTANSTWKSPYTNRKQWATELINAYKKAGITNDNAIRMLLAQDALESSWGKSAQGKYNFGNLTTGSSWKGNYVTGNDKNAKGEAIKQKFRSYNSMDEYAADKVQFLKRLYDFDENDDINKFVAKLTGSNKGKRRYAEATNYAKVLTGVYNGIPKGENGMIIKYQNPPHGIARRDAIKDYRPEIPLSPIKQPVKPYMPTQQPILSPDNRTGWEKEVSRQIKADRAKNENLYGNQHTWNWSAPFTNARITKDNASAMFDFDKSAAMSTFAIGQGIASPVTTATSIAGSLVGAGIGNKVAGEKGALVGGFVGGLLGDRTLNAVKNINNKNMGIVSNAFRKSNNKFKSELDWDEFNPDIPKERLEQYYRIEEATKKNGTWMKNPDGTPFEGSPYWFVQSHSKEWAEYMKHYGVTDPNDYSYMTRGLNYTNSKFPWIEDPEPTELTGRVLFGTEGLHSNKTLKAALPGAYSLDDTHIFKKASDTKDIGLVELAYPNIEFRSSIDAKGADFDNLGHGIHSTEGLRFLMNFDPTGTPAVVKIKNVNDNGLRNDVVIDGARLYPKSIWGNDGSFSFTGKNRDNIFKTLAPFLIGSGTLLINYGL